MANPNNFPDIEGSELVSKSWMKLLERDASVKKQFAASEFPEVTSEDVGTPCYREDLQKWFIFIGMGELDTPIWWCPFDDIKAQGVTFIPNESNFPATVDNVEDALNYLAEKELPNAIIFPAESSEFNADGITVEYPLQKVTSQPSTVQVFFSGVKQSPSSYKLVNNGKSILFNEPPAYGETILIQENASILEYDLMPIEGTFVADNETTFLMPTDVVDVRTIQVNVEGKVLQHNEYTVQGRNVILNEPVTGNVQITTIYKGIVNAPSINTVGEYEIIDGSITESKMAENSVGEANIKNAAVSTGKIANFSVTEDKLAENIIGTDKVKDGSITFDKLDEIVHAKLLGVNRVDGSMLQDGIVNLSKLGQDVIDSIAEGNAYVIDAGYNTKGVVKFATAEEVINQTGSTKVLTSEVLNELIDAEILGGGNAAKLDENNTFTGSNTFNKVVTSNTQPINFIAQSNAIEKGVTPTADQYCGYDFRGKDGVRLAYLGIHYDSDGSKYLELQRIDANLTHLSSQFPIRVPTPVDSENSTIVPTTAWVISRITDIMDNNDYVIETYINGTSWYRIYKSGWIEQGGTCNLNSTVTFVKPFATANYTIVTSTTSGYYENVYVRNQSTTSVAIGASSYDANYRLVRWYATGEVAS